MRFPLPLLAILSLAAACGSDGDGASADAAPQADAPASNCIDDEHEDDDDFESARVPDFSGLDNEVTYMGSKICAGDEDWYYLALFGGEAAQVAITFEQQSAAEDLDIVIWTGQCIDADGDFEIDDCTLGSLLTPCTDDDTAGCNAELGQSRDSNERLTFSSDEGGHYWFVVRGFQGAENTYDFCMAIDDGICP
jgi:hypothetical protein